MPELDPKNISAELEDQIRQIIREEIDEHNALSSSRDPEDYALLRRALVADRHTIEEQRAGRWPYQGAARWGGAATPKCEATALAKA